MLLVAGRPPGTVAKSKRARKRALDDFACRRPPLSPLLQEKKLKDKFEEVRLTRATRWPP